MSQFAGDIQQLLVHLGHDRAHIWGTSAGGPITLAFGFDYPEVAQSLVITDSAAWLSQDEDLLSALRKRIEILENDGPEAAYQARRDEGTVGLDLFAANRSDQPAAKKAGPKAPTGADAIRAQLAGVPREERIAKYAGELRTYGAYIDWDGSDRFGQLSMPVLVLYGAEDRVFPNAGWQELCADKRSVVYRAYEGVGHGLATRAPRSMDEICTFLKMNSS